MIIYKEHLWYVGLGLAVLILVIIAISRYRKSLPSSNLKSKEASSDKVSADDTMNGYIGGHYPNASNSL